ncbi:hypothetical protein [Vibrio nitrifigilis]|uniref:WD40 repeat protein n=1 Tax=Vibrio nitrifigilis TaxID=2789781 RepID=A0ABS0GDL1_9VIBR|nr:hypothetical protein [Vibrio nitrifigilis]MBF9000462.1 hypothetical protein [Vibrio nitrifigilis]
MKWMHKLLASVALLVAPYAISHENKSHDLTQFDQPLLLGDWYFVNPEPEKSQDGFLAIKMSFHSNYQFTIDIQKKDYDIDHWEGLYSATDHTLAMDLGNDSPHIYEYKGNHNMLYMNGLYFTKGLPNALAGMWSSESVSSDDNNMSDAVTHVDLLLQPDFVFLFRATDAKGEQKVHQGVYYTEQDHLVLMYEKGEHDTTFSLKDNKLTLKVEDGAMLAVLDRVK